MESWSRAATVLGRVAVLAWQHGLRDEGPASVYGPRRGGEGGAGLRERYARASHAVSARGASATRAPRAASWTLADGPRDGARLRSRGAAAAWGRAASPWRP